MGLAILGLLGVNTLPVLLKRRVGIERFFGFTLTAVGAFMLSDVLFGMWFDETWAHEAWNWTMSRINPNFGEIHAADHFHVHGGPVTGFLFFVLAGFVVPGVWLHVKGLAGKAAPVTAAGIWRGSTELKAMYEAAGVTKDKTIVVQGDVTDLGHHTFLVLRALGYRHVRSYDRSWSEWGPDSNLPKVDGQGKLRLVARTAP